MSAEKLLEAPSWHCVAEYTAAEFPEYMGNPLIEAMPPFMEKGFPFESFAEYPYFHVNERDRSNNYRIQAVCRLRTYMELLPFHGRVMRDIYTNIWSGYAYRNPINKLGRQDGNEEINESRTQRRYRESKAGRYSAFIDAEPTSATVFGLYGLSGIGKTMSARRALSFLPQVIHHPVHNFTQLVWLWVECPADGSVGPLMRLILKEADRVLDTSYSKHINERTSVPNLVELVSNVLRRHHIGLLILDEFQNAAKAAKKSKIMDFFLTFINANKFPIMTIGVEDALGLLPGNLYTARRICDSGVNLVRELSVEEWNIFIQGLCEFQWTRKVADVHLIEPYLRELSQANPGIAVRLFILSQIDAIISGKELVTVNTLRRVANAKMAPAMPILKAMRKSRKSSELADKNIRELIESLEGEIDSAGKQAKLVEAARSRAENERLHDAASHLISLGKSQDKVVQVLSKLMKKNKSWDTADLVAEYLVDERRQSDSCGELERRIAEGMEAEHRSDMKTEK